MSLSYAILLIISIEVLSGIIAGLIVLTYYRGKRSIQENIKRCLVFIRNGSHWQPPIKGRLTQQSAMGDTYDYGKGKTIIVPRKYVIEWYKGYRLLFLSNGGKILASNSIDGKNVSSKSSKNSDISEKESIIYEVLHANLGGGAIKAIKSAQTTAINITLIIVALFIGAIITFGIVQIQRQTSTSTPSTSTPSTSTPSTSIPSTSEAQQRLVPIEGGE